MDKMRLHSLVSRCLCLCSLFLGISASVPQDFASLPRIFYVNETEVCPEGHLYCKINVRLKPKDLKHPPELWKLMDKKSVYERNCMYRAFCIGEESVQEKIDQELNDFNLTGDIVQSYCSRKDGWIRDGFGWHDIIVVLLMLTFLGFVISSTMKTLNPNYKTNKYQEWLSIANTWKDINRPNRNEDFNNLLSIQGMRTLAMILVIGIHSFLATIIFKFVRNPEYFEEVPFSVAKSIFYGSFGLTVQIYFVISAWLLSVQLHNIVKRNGKFTWRDLRLLWLNRYLRLLPAIIVAMAAHTVDTGAILVTHPYFYSIGRREVQRCRAIWWKHLIFMQNIDIKENELCTPNMWFIAVDFQMYVIVSLFFYISRRFRFSMKYFIGLIAGVSMLIQIFNVLTTDFDGLLHFNPRLLPIEDFSSKPEITISYMKTYGSAITYIIGFMFGTLYWKNKNRVIFDTMDKKLLFYGAFLGLPILACYLYEFRSNRLVEALQSVSLRPLYSLGIAVGLLGMATGSGGYIKRFLESKFMVFFANFTYSTYMFHLTLVFGRGVFNISYVEVDDFYCYTNWIIDVIISFALGMFMYIVLEAPCLKLQKNLVPQISNGKKKE